MAERRPGVWRLRVYVGKDGRGRPMQQSRTVHGGRRHAENELRRFLDESRPVSPQKMTVGELLDTWLDHIRPNVSAYTLRGYRYAVNGPLREAFGSVRLADLNARMLDRAYRRWLDGGAAPATVRRRHTMLSAACRQAVKWDWLVDPPTSKATPPQIVRRPGPTISSEELQRLVSACDDDTLAMAIVLAAVTGCRRGELLALHWTDLDGSTLTVARSLTYLDRKASVGPTKTHQVRRLALDPTVLRLLEEYRAWQAEYWDTTDSAIIPLQPGYVSKQFRKLTRSLGMPYHFHDLRHFAATTLIAGGVNVRTVATRLGHATPTLTLSTYAHAVEAADHEAAALLGRQLGP